MMMADAVWFSPAVREPLPQLPKKVPWYSSDTGGISLPPSLVLAVFGVRLTDPPALSRSATALAFGAHLPAIVRVTGRGQTG